MLTLAAADAGGLPEPRENPAVMEADPDDVAPDDLGDKLRRAWDRISGNYSAAEYPGGSCASC